MTESQNNNKKLIQAKFIIGILAGKGGVGKSTVAGCLARALHRSGQRVGVLDADIYGPSIRALLPEDQPPKVEGERVYPAQSGGVSVMSTAYFPRDKGPSVVRAPIATQIVSQFIQEVEWGPLDILLVDFPPGTGDIQISLTQNLFFNSAVVVTTPQELSLLDVRKSMRMCIQMGVPLLGVVENMSYFLEPSSKKRRFLFGEGGGKTLSEEFQVPLLAEIPIEQDLMANGQAPFDTLANRILSMLQEEKKYKINAEDQYHFSIEWLDGKKSLYCFADVQTYCPCIECIGKQQPPSEVVGEKIARVGNYGIQIRFSAGCSKGIYPFSLLRDLDR